MCIRDSGGCLFHPTAHKVPAVTEEIAAVGAVPRGRGRVLRADGDTQLCERHLLYAPAVDSEVNLRIGAGLRAPLEPALLCLFARQAAELHAQHLRAGKDPLAAVRGGADTDRRQHHHRRGDGKAEPDGAALL